MFAERLDVADAAHRLTVSVGGAFVIAAKAGIHPGQLSSKIF
jgi:hypothetical protein